MTRNDLFALAQKKGHQVIFTDLCENEAFATEVDGACYIAMDMLLPEADEVELLAHELGHCEYAGFYSRITPLNTRARVEYRAKKWQFLKLVPLGELRAAIRRGVTAPWELSEYFSVSESFIMDACTYYTNACGSIMADSAI